MKTTILSTNQTPTENSVPCFFPTARLVLSEDLIILQASSNLSALIPCAVDSLLNQHLSALFPEAQLIPLQDALASEDLTQYNPFSFSLEIDQKTCYFYGVVQCHIQLLLLELEPLSFTEKTYFYRYYNLAQNIIAHFQRFHTIAPLLASAAYEIRGFTNYDRVVVYRLDERGNSYVLAEDRRTGLSAFSDHRFTASPKKLSQLRYPYCSQSLIDVDNPTLELLPPRNPYTGEVLDSRTFPSQFLIPNEHLRSIKVQSVLLLPLFQGEVAWGLLVCYHYTPKLVNYPHRKSCEIIAQSLSLQLATQSEESFSQGEELYRSVIMALEEGIVLQNVDGSIYALNPSAERILGLPITKEGLLNSPRQRIIREDGTSFSYDTHPVMATLRSGQPLSDIVIGLCKPKGHIVWLSLNSRPLFRIDSSRPYAAVASFVDITERKLAKEALQKSEARLAEAQQLAHLGHWEWDLISGEEQCSAEMLNVLGLSAHSNHFTHELFENALHPDDKEIVLRAFAAAIDKNKPYNLEFRLIRRDGAIRHIQAIGKLVRDAHGKPLRLIGTAQDISERKQVEEALRRSEMRLAEAQQLAHLGYWEWDLISGEEQCSAEMLHLLGLESGTGFTHEIFERALHPHDREVVLQAFEQAIRENMPYNIEFRLMRRDNVVYHVEALGKLIRDTAGKPLRLIGTAQDITAKKQVEQALRESEHYRRTLIEESLIGLVLFRKDGLIVEANSSFAHLIGYAIEDIVYQLNHAQITPPYYLQKDAEQQRILLTKGRFGPYEKEYLHKQGHSITVRLFAVIIEHQGEQCIWANVEDITEQKQSAARLQEANVKLSQFKAILDMTIDCLFISDAKTFKFVYVNQGAINHLGYSQKEFMQMTHLNLLPTFTLEHYQTLIRPLLNGRQSVQRYEAVHRCKNSVLIPVEISLQYVQIEGQPERFIAISRDISERKKNEAQLQQAKEVAETAKIAAEVANRAKSIFLANMSHELRTPLNAILGFAQILNLDHNLTSQQHDAIETIRRGGEYLLMLINDILDISKIEAGRIELQLTDFHLEQFLKGLVDLFKMRAEQKGISFIYQPLLPLPIVIHADEKRLRQILINLLSNAIKFTEKGSVILKIGYQNIVPQFWTRGLNKRPIVERDPTLHRLRFQVEDTGNGILPQDMEKIFLPFHQVGNPNYSDEGTGLGLAITKTLVEMMSGELHVESTYKQGSIFWAAMDLPEVTSGLPALKSTSTPAIVGYERQGNCAYRILIVDDRDENRLLLTNLLEPLGFEVIEASGGQESVEKARNLHPDAILMDLIMPMIDGFEATRQIRRIPELRSVVIIAISASAFSHHQQKSKEVGCNDFIAKPLHSEVLLECLQKHLNITWIYAQTTQVMGHVALSEEYESETPAKLSLEQVTTLFNMALIGDIQGILEYVQKLEQTDEQLHSFAWKIHRLADQLEIRKIYEIARQYVESMQKPSE